MSTILVSGWVVHCTRQVPCSVPSVDDAVQAVRGVHASLSSSRAVDDPADSVDQQDKWDQEKDYLNSKPRPIDCHERDDH